MQKEKRMNHFSNDSIFSFWRLKVRSNWWSRLNLISHRKHRIKGTNKRGKRNERIPNRAPLTSYDKWGLPCKRFDHWIAYVVAIWH